jgi:hypothetical protein
MYKVYVAKLSRKEKVKELPNTVYKIGITQSSDALRPLLNDNSTTPITSVFGGIKILSSVLVESETKAKEIERRIASDISARGYFHNWNEPTQVNGITKMRVWNYPEVQRIIKIFEEYR